MSTYGCDGSRLNLVMYSFTLSVCREEARQLDDGIRLRERGDAHGLSFPGFPFTLEAGDVDVAQGSPPPIQDAEPQHLSACLGCWNRHARYMGEVSFVCQFNGCGDLLILR